MSENEQTETQAAEQPRAEIAEGDLESVSGGINPLLLPLIVVTIPTPEGTTSS